MYVFAGARFTEPAAQQYGTRWQHKPRFLSYGPGRTDHDRQQHGPVPQQVGTRSVVLSPERARARDFLI